MKTRKFWPVITQKIAIIATYALTAALFVCANTNSCCMVHQPKYPNGIEDYSYIR